MYRPIFACDRCGHWYTTAREWAHRELDYAPEAKRIGPWDLCEACTRGIYEWFEAGKGVEVKPRILK